MNFSGYNRQKNGVQTKKKNQDHQTRECRKSSADRQGVIDLILSTRKKKSIGNFQICKQEFQGPFVYNSTKGTKK